MYGFVNQLQIAKMKYKLRLEYIVFEHMKWLCFKDIKSVLDDLAAFGSNHGTILFISRFT